ncbi:MAG: hypothetical protein QW416_06560 [Candidatus Nitrosocaldaceae archaeon]
MPAFLVFYQFKTMSKEEVERAKKEWDNIKKSLPAGVELAGEYDHAWGSEYNGFLLFHASNTDTFLNWWPNFKDNIRWYVTKTHTIVAKKR